MRKLNLVKFIVIAALALSTVIAAEFKSFSSDLFMSAQSDNKTVLLDFHADWCGTCHAQRKSLNTIFEDQAYSEIVPLEVNYDEAEELKKQYNVRSQSTLVLVKNGKVIDTSIGVTSPSLLKVFLNKGL